MAYHVRPSDSEKARIDVSPLSCPSWARALLLLAAASCCEAQSNNQTLMRFPTLHGDSIVFEAHGNLWRVNRSGGVAERLTSEPGYELMPRYSPDGRWIAFTGHYEGNGDVYVMAASGGPVRRLTFHSDVVDHPPARWGPDNMVIGWTPDSERIIYLSRRTSWVPSYPRLFSVAVMGGMSAPLPLDRGGLLSYSPDGKQIAYNRIFRNFRTWKRYDGGLAQDIDLYDFSTRKLTHLTDWPGTETAPMWVGNTVYFLSDHDAQRRENIWAVDLATHEFREITHFTDFDIDFPSLGDNGITFQQGGSLYVLDLPASSCTSCRCRCPTTACTRGRTSSMRGQFIRDDDAAQDTDYDVAPNGGRAVLAARGDLFTVPAEFGSTRNLTESSNADEDHPAWSPDGTLIAYTTDACGSQQMAVRPAAGGPERMLTHFTSGYFYRPVWAPGGDRLAFSDHEHRLWTVGLKGGGAAADRERSLQEIHDYSFSPDGRWLAYSLNDANELRSIWLANLDSHHADAREPARATTTTGRVFDPRRPAPLLHLDAPRKSGAERRRIRRLEPQEHGPVCRDPEQGRPVAVRAAFR